MTRTKILLLTLLCALGAPSAAQAEEGFAGLLEDGRLVTFRAANPSALSAPLAPSGLAGGERLVALGTGPGGLVAVGSTARLYAVDAQTGRATGVGPAFAQGLRGTRFSLASRPGSATGRLLSDVGQDLDVDLRTGAVQAGPGLRRDDGTAIGPAVDLGADGRLVGVALGAAGGLFRETAPGSSTFSTSTAIRATARREAGGAVAEPIGVEVDGRGVGYLLAVLSDQRRLRQSALIVFDPLTGEPYGKRFGSFFRRRLAAIASLGAVPEDRQAPAVDISLPRKVSVRALVARRFPLAIRSSEAGQIVVDLQISGRFVGREFLNRDTPGVFRSNSLSLQLERAARPALRRAAGKRLRVSLSVKDGAGNRRTFVRVARLTR